MKKKLLFSAIAVLISSISASAYVYWLKCDPTKCVTTVDETFFNSIDDWEEYCQYLEEIYCDPNFKWGEIDPSLEPPFQVP